MSLSQNLNEFRFNLDTLDLMTSMGRTTEQATTMLTELGFNQQLVQFMVSHRNILNMVLLRLQLYSEQNTNEAKVRSGLASLNNSSVHTLLDYLFKTPTATVVTVKKSTSVVTPVVTAVVTAVSPPTPPVLVPDDESEAEAEVEEEEENFFETFFSAHVRESDDATNSVKLSHMYETFTKWWNNVYTDEVPSKDDLKEFFSEKLGRPVKSTISNVILV
jgi:hypothetical protein